MTKMLRNLPEIGETVFTNALGQEGERVRVIALTGNGSVLVETEDHTRVIVNYKFLY